MHGPRHALISGGSSGIGLALAMRLVAAGWNVSVLSRSTAKLARAQSRLNTARATPEQRVVTVAVDVVERAALDAATHEAIAELGAPALLVACAGVVETGHFADLSPEAFERCMAVNYFGAVHLVRAALPAMRAGAAIAELRRPRIVLVCSAAGLVGVFGYTAYAASKFALRGFAEALRAELRPQGIGVSIVFPPDTDTPQLAAENQVRLPQTRAIASCTAVWSAEAVARHIVRGVDRERFRICPGWETRALAWFHSLLAPLIFRYFDRLAARARDDADQP